MTPSALAQGPVAIAVATPDVYANCVALMVHFSEFGNRRSVDLDTEVIGDGETDKDYLSLSKSLIDKAALRPIKRLINETREALLTKAAVPSFAADGMYLLSVAGVERAEMILTDAQRQLGYLVDAILVDYPALIDQARLRLGPLFHLEDYPTVANLRARFGMSWRYLSLGAPAQLQVVGGAFLAAERAKVAAASHDAAIEIRNLYRASLLDLTAHMVDRLEPTEANGKKRRFHESALDNLTAFLDADPIRNVTGDADIRALTERMRAILAGVDVDAIRTNEALRAAVQANLADVKVELDALVREGRAIVVE